MIDKDYITEKCDSLPMVQWDRCILMEDYHHAVVYGWIKDKDKTPGPADFVVIQFWFDPEPEDPIVSYITSSVEWSARISGILLPGTEHLPCQMVHDELPDLKRKVYRVGDPFTPEPPVVTNEIIGMGPVHD